MSQCDDVSVFVGWFFFEPRFFFVVASGGGLLPLTFLVLPEKIFVPSWGVLLAFLILWSKNVLIECADSSRHMR